jgi:hypothetical protein
MSYRYKWSVRRKTILKGKGERAWRGGRGRRGWRGGRGGRWRGERGGEEREGEREGERRERGTPINNYYTYYY